MGVGGVQFPRLFPEKVMPKERRRGIETGYATQNQILLFQYFGRATGHMRAETETDHVNVEGIDAQVNRV